MPSNAVGERSFSTLTRINDRFKNQILYDDLIQRLAIFFNEILLNFFALNA